ncbi:MAG: hypothetical protein AAF556_09550 [Pseudomonadota bacterium]
MADNQPTTNRPATNQAAPNQAAPSQAASGQSTSSPSLRSRWGGRLLAATAAALPAAPAVSQDEVLDALRAPATPIITPYSADTGAAQVFQAQAAIPRADLNIGAEGRACITYTSPSVPRGALIMFDVNSGPNRPDIIPMMLTEIGQMPTMGQDRYCDTVQNFRADAETRSIELGKDIAQLVRQAAEATGKTELAQGTEILEDEDFARNLFPLTNTAESMFLRAARAYPAIWQDPVGQTIKDRGIASKKAAFIIESTENLLPLLEAHFTDPENNPFPGMPAPMPEGIPINLQMERDGGPDAWNVQHAVFDGQSGAALTLAQATQPSVDEATQTPGQRGYVCATYASATHPVGGIIVANVGMSAHGLRDVERPGQHPITEGDVLAGDLECETIDEFLAGVENRAAQFGRDMAALTRRFAEGVGQPEIAAGVERLEAEGFGTDLSEASRLTREYFDRIVTAGQDVPAARLQEIVPAEELHDMMRRGSEGDTELNLARNARAQLANLEAKFGPRVEGEPAGVPIRWQSGPDAVIEREASIVPDEAPRTVVASNDQGFRPRTLTA